MRRGIAYPVELRERVLKVCALERSHTWEQAAELFGVGVATVNRWIALHPRSDNAASLGMSSDGNTMLELGA